MSKTLPELDPANTVDEADEVFASASGQPSRVSFGAVADLARRVVLSGARVSISVSDVLADTTVWDPDERLVTLEEGFSYRVAEPDATDHHITNAGGAKLYVLPAPDGAFHSAAFGIVPGVDQTDAFETFFSAVAGRKAVIDYATTAYIANNLRPRTGTHLTIESGVEITGNGNGSVRILSINVVDDVTVMGYGAKINMPDADISHAVVINRAKRILVEGLEISGPGLPDIHESDCVYIGGDPDNDDVCQRITLRNLTAYGARRNILSIAGGHHILIEGCELHTTVDGTFKKGIDLEANKWMANGESPVKYVTIRKCHIYNVLSDGIAIIWADHTIIEDCLIETAGDYGVNITAPPNFHNQTKNPRPGDSLGVSAIDDSTGWITVSTDPGGQLLEDHGITPGMVVAFGTTGTGALPPEVSGFMFISEISSDQTQIRLTDNSNDGVITSFTDAGAGTLSNDPETSEIVCKVYRDGASSNVVIRNNVFSGNTLHDIRLSVASNITIQGNTLRPESATANGLGTQICSFVSVSDNKIYGKNTGRTGISLDRVWRARTSSNEISGCLREGVFATLCSSAELFGDYCYGCGTSSSYGAAFAVDKSRGVKVSPKVRNGPVASTRGIRLHTNAELCLITGADCENAGTTNVSSISDAGTNNRVVDSRLFDGSFST